MKSCIYDVDANESIDRAISRLHAEIERRMPVLAANVIRWTVSLSSTDDPGDYFRDIRGFPMLLLPRWLAEAVDAKRDARFEDDVVYSTVAGYYFVRLIDNLTDDQASVEKDILGVAPLLHTEFQRVYHLYFDPAHEFWHVFRREWARGFDAAAAENRSAAIDRERFQEISVTKTCAGRIPLIAAAYHYAVDDRLADWISFCDSVSGWVQMRDDLFDWHRDLQAGATTYFLSEAGHRMRSGETLVEWIAREGAEWGVSELWQLHELVRSRSALLGAPGVDRYVAELEAWMTERAREYADGMAELAKIAGAWA